MNACSLTMYFLFLIFWRNEKWKKNCNLTFQHVHCAIYLIVHFYLSMHGTKMYLIFFKKNVFAHENIQKSISLNFHFEYYLNSDHRWIHFNKMTVPEIEYVKLPKNITKACWIHKFLQIIFRFGRNRSANALRIYIYRANGKRRFRSCELLFVAWFKAETWKSYSMVLFRFSFSIQRNVGHNEILRTWIIFISSVELKYRNSMMSTIWWHRWS